uniref:Hemopexin n=1 Tax=Candidatus Kentrum sp. UNK TaxID=2126344 RepID=A0A451ACX4_9GAMM|nr:MAG: Hemopexin [Candidatus Kentron sp. UNK]VFK70947.1 MAG: Hemopexin [Candidatus Kentron sp. UNK]
MGARAVAEKWGRSEYDFGHVDHIDAAMASGGDYLLFLDDKVVKYRGSIELADLQPEEGYPKPIHEEFPALPAKFTAGISAALDGLDGKTYLFHDDDCAIIELEDGETTVTETRTNEKWGLIDNPIADSGAVDAAFVGLDGRTYLFSGARYTRYSGSDYTQVDDGFPRDIAEDWEGLTSVTAAFVLDNKTYLFGAGEDGANLYVRYSTLHVEEDDYLEVDEEDPNARVIEVKLANRPDVDEIEVFPAPVDAEFWSLPDSLTGGAEDFQIDAIMNGPEGKVYLFAGGKYIEHDHASRWWSEPKTLSEQWDRVPEGLGNTKAAFTGKDGRTYLFYLDVRDEQNKFLRFSDPELYNLDNGYPRPTSRYWGRVRNNIEETGRVDAALVVESRWEEQDKEGQLVDYVEDHTYLFSGDQMFRYKGAGDYSKVEQGYPRAISRIKEEPRFRGLEVDFPDGIDAAFADQRQIYLFRGDTFHAVIGDEDNYKQYEDSKFANIDAVTQEEGVTYILGSEGGAVWNKLNHLEARTLIETPATPRAAEKAEGSLTGAISAILHGADRNTYVFADTNYYDVSLERVFAINEVFGRSTNPIHDQETIDAAFVGRDGVTYVFSGEWFVQYDTGTYIDKTVVYPPRRIRDKWPGLTNVALAYVWKEETYLFERPDADGHFHYLRYSRDSYEQPDSGYPRAGEHDFWQIPQAYLQEGFDQVDAIFVQEDNLIFISDQKFINFNLDKGTWGYPRELDLIYQGIPFNKTDFKDLKSGFVGADSKVYFFSDQTYVVYDEESGWSGVANIEDDWGLQTNIFDKGVDAAYVSPDGVTYLFKDDEYVRYSGGNYRYVDESYPKEIATYLLDEPAFSFMTKEFQQHLDAMEADNHTPFFDGIVDNGRCLYFFTRDTLFTGSPGKYAAYGIEGLGHVENNFTNGGYVDAAFVDTDNDKTYLFSGEQYIRYAGDDYRYMEAGYPKIIAEDLAGELGVASITENYRDGIDAAFYLSSLGVVFFNDRNYLNIQSGNSVAGDINDVWGKLDSAFHSADKTIDGAYVDDEGRLHVFKGQQFARYSDSSELLALNPYDEARYVDPEYPQDITEQWPQLPDSILTESGIGAVFRFEDEIHFHTGGNFVAYEVDLSDHDEEVPVQVLAYRWGEWSDYLLSDVHALSRFKDLGQKFTGGNMTLTEFVSGAHGKVEEPYMEFAAIFGFDKEDVRWVRQRNAFLPGKINVLEEDFDLELVLRLYDILATTRRLRVDVSSLYNDVWSKLYGATPDYKTAAEGAYDLLAQVDCNNNYETLVDQITDELNVIKRDALATYVIANDSDITTTRGLYQKLLIDIQMASCAKTSRIKEAIGAVQLYLHRYFINLEDVDLDASDQQAARETLKERWKWLRNYRVWEANRKVFLYPENYIRPELRDPDTISAAFEALRESLSQGELTEDAVEAAYFKYLDSYSEVSELAIAGGYVYDDDSDGDGEDDKVLVLFGRTRADPMRYFYRFATFVGGSSTDITWEPWKELPIKIESSRVEPVFAFDRVFVFWPVLQKVVSSDAEEAEAKEDGNVTTLDSTDKIEYRIKVYYSFYNLNKEWSQPQLLNTEFNGAEELLIGDGKISEEDIKLFVENSSKLDNYDSAYENIYIRVRYTTVSDVTVDGVTTQKSTTDYKAFNLMPERYSQSATVQTIDNRGQELFRTLFPHEYDYDSGEAIDEDNVVMLNAIENSLDGPWFAYNHNGSGFLVKPDAETIDSSLWPKSISGSGMPSANITAAVQVKDGGDVYFFLDDKTYVSSSNLSAAADINSRWGMESTTDIQLTGKVDSAFVRSGSAYLTLDDQLYEYNGSDMDLMVKAPYALSTVITEIPDNWTNVDAAFTTSGGVNFCFNTDTGSVLQSDTGNISTIRTRFGLPHVTKAPIDTADDTVVYDGKLHVIHDGAYTVYDTSGAGTSKGAATVGTVLDGLFGKTVAGINGPGYAVTGLMVINDGVIILSSLCQQFVDSTGTLGSLIFDVSSGWTAGVEYRAKLYRIVWYDETATYGTMNINLFDGPIGYSMKNFTTNVNVTAAFTSDDGKRVMIVTDNTTCHLFSDTQEPKEILEQLESGANSVPLANLDIDVYLGAGMQSNNIWMNNAVDAAIIGTSTLGTDGKLYLFSGSQYFRFTQDGDGEYPVTADDGYPKSIAGNSEIDSFPSGWSQVDAAFTGPSNNVSYLFNNSTKEFYRSDTKATASTAEQWGLYASTDLMANQVVDAAYSAGGYLYLIVGDEICRYTLNADGSIPAYIDSAYPKDLPDGVSVDAVFELGDYLYFFSGSSYYRLKTSSTTDPTTLSGASPISGSWGNIPSDIRNNGLSAAYNVTDSDGVKTLYFIQDGNYLDYAISTDDSSDEQPYEFDEVNYEVIRLTSSTGEQFNRILFAGEIADLLKMSTQEINESPTISTADSAPDNIQMNSDRFATDKEPINTHLDFNTGNGLYYWEIFFHAPFLIAQTLNEDQKFEDAKKWFEYIYDPTDVADYWKFLPFLATDPDALMATLRDDLENFRTLTPATDDGDSTAEQKLTAAEEALDGTDDGTEGLADKLAPFQDVFLGLKSQDSLEAQDGVSKLADIEDKDEWPTYKALVTAVGELTTTSTSNSTTDNALLVTWKSEMQEVLEIIKKLDYRLTLMDNYSTQLTEHLEDPFDPHAIAALRPLAYRKAIVMRYVDNLLDWGDMLFRQYTRESIDEARMLYILAYDLLGEKPENLGEVVLEKTKAYEDLTHDEGAGKYDFLIDLEDELGASVTDYSENLSFGATQYDTVVNPYFYLKENELFTEYWDRVEDRLDKIRNCLNIDGIAQPLPLFQPPIDPMALVKAAAGGGIAGAMAAAVGGATVPDYRFDALLAKARELVGRLKGLGDNLLSTLEKKDSEALSLLQNKQEAAMLALATRLKQQQIKEAETSLENIQESLARAKEQESHYKGLISAGKLREEEAQIGMMSTAAAIHGLTALGKIVAGLSYVVPQVTAGAFSFGVTSGGQHIGGMLDKFAETVEPIAQGLEMGGEVAGIVAQYKRSREDWRLQEKMAASEIKQLEFEIDAQDIRIEMARHELAIHERDIENNQAIKAFMKGKFTNEQLYNWMSGKIAGLFFQTYKMAHDYAKQAEQAFVFEKGIEAGEVNYVRGAYWDSQRKGLLAGATLELDLDRMDKAYMESDSRGFEITRNISLLEIDPLALLQLKTRGVCNFRLTEELFDYDFPGHYNRQIKTISLAFDIGEGQAVNATLTQLNSKLVLAPDIKAVKHLIDPANEANTSVRVNWRANQQVALSHTDQYTENNGMFELNFRDERYLPFEGTGVVSNWRLKLEGTKGAYNPADLLDVTIKLRYTASQGGQRFATEVKGALKPYNATSFFDLAYNFPDEWAALTQGGEDEAAIRFTRDMFPNMSSSRIIGLFIRYQYEKGMSGAILTIEDDLQVPNNTYLQPATLSVGQEGVDWAFALKGDRSTLKNAEMVLVYKAKL